MSLEKYGEALECARSFTNIAIRNLEKAYDMLIKAHNIADDAELEIYPVAAIMVSIGTIDGNLEAISAILDKWVIDIQNDEGKELK